MARGQGGILVLVTKQYSCSSHRLSLPRNKFGVARDRSNPQQPKIVKDTGGQGGIRTPEGRSQQIYSLPRLTTSVPTRPPDMIMLSNSPYYIIGAPNISI